ncbi:MAG: YrbL family protein [Pseudomonadota bacterium]
MQIDLEGQKIVARGKNRDLYRHPRDAGALIKVVNASRQRKEAARSWLAQRLKPSYTREFMSEIDAVYRAHRRAQWLGVPRTRRLPIIETVGLVATSKGMGLVVERLAAPNGELAPTLKTLIEVGDFDQRRLARLNDFVERIFALRIVADDFDPKNIVWDAQSESFVMIDGFGEKPVVPIHVWSRKINDFQLRAAIAERLARRAGLQWDARRRTLSFQSATETA